MRIHLTPRHRLPALDPVPRPEPTAQSLAPASPVRVAPGVRAGINPANLQAVLDSAPNAAAKGQAQWHTPVEWSAALACALPAYRPVMVDLTCGTGQLLHGSAAPSTHHLLGCDIEAFASPIAPSGQDFIPADITRLAPLLKAANWQADCFVLNPPFDLHWYRERLAFLSQSKCWAVEQAFAAHDGRTSRTALPPGSESSPPAPSPAPRAPVPGTIDSTIATLCLALDRCSPWGEGCLIANASTIERLLYAPGAPHAKLADHIWARLTIAGNICAPECGRLGRDASDASDSEAATFATAVLYFARSHTNGCQRHDQIALAPDGSANLDRTRMACEYLGKSRFHLRAGNSIRTAEGGHSPKTADLWSAVALEWRTRESQNRPGDRRWNIWLDVDGTIATDLTPFEECQPLKRAQYTALHALKGKHPMQLILQKAERKELERAVFGEDYQSMAMADPSSPSPHGPVRAGPWRVAPAVSAAVRQALADYQTQRAPLYPLNQIQRLGYLDDNDDILCTADLDDGGASFGIGPSGQDPVFRAGQRYQIRTQTLSVKRVGRKMNLTGELDDVQWEGSELALFITGEDKKEHLFMEERLRRSDVRLSIQQENAPSPIQFTLAQLIDHFAIPEVPDVASQNPAGYQRNLDLLKQIEAIVNA